MKSTISSFLGLILTLTANQYSSQNIGYINEMTSILNNTSFVY